MREPSAKVGGWSRGGFARAMGLWGRLHPENVAEGGRLIDKGTENGAIAGFRVRTSSAARGPLIAHLYDLGERGFRLVGLERTD